MGDYYTVNQVIYQSKIEALYAGTRTGHQVHWHWHDEYNHVPWISESPYTLREVYKTRAQQLRDNYDWLTLSFSGGSDSWTVLNSFLSNNIHLDEIFVRWPIKATENIYIPDPTDLRPVNLLSEWDLSIAPELRRISQAHPEIKITVYDWSDDLKNFKHNDDHVTQTQSCFVPGYWIRFGAIGEHEQAAIDSGKKNCVIFGADKPQIMVKDNQVYCYFLDILANTNQSLPGQNRSTEFFYWSKDCTEVTHTQARAIYHYLCVHPEAVPLVDARYPYSRERKDQWDKVARSIIYQDYNPLTFQAKKDSNGFYSQYDAWMTDATLPDPLFLQRWQHMVDNIFASIDKKYFNYENGKPTGLSGFISPLYFLGNLPEVDHN